MDIQEKPIILVVDDDERLCALIAEYLNGFGCKPVTAHNGVQALEVFYKVKPNAVLIDLQMPEMGGLEFLEEIRNNDLFTPILIMTANPDVDTAIKAIRSGAFDYLIKPVRLPVLLQKVKDALKSKKMVQENAILSELASLHDITMRLTNTHDLEQLLGEALDSCMTVALADSGSIQLINKQTNELLMVQHRGIKVNNLRCMLDDEQSTVSKWVIHTNKALIMTGGNMIPETHIPLTRNEIGSSISVPLRVQNESIGVINLNRHLGKEPFALVQLNVIEVLATQTGVAINNANLYSSVNQKLADLSLIGTYSARLMGLVEKSQIVNCLFETIRKHFSVDVIAYLLPEKRTNNLLYWARRTPTAGVLYGVAEKIIDDFFTHTQQKINLKRIKYSPWSPADQTGEIAGKFAFWRVLHLSADQAEHGLIYIAAIEPFNDESEKISLLSSLINQTGIALTNAKLYNDMKENYIKTIKALAIAVDAKDTYTHGHSENVMNIAAEIAQEMDLSERLTSSIRDGALLHDIGKIGIPGTILNKPGSLTHEEFNGVMKNHAALGANIVKDVPFLKDLHDLILFHHENWDGSGYPNGLKGEHIPLGARIVHVADAFEAMTSNRPYRNSLGKEEAFRRLREERGFQFDPKIVDAFFALAAKKGWVEKV